MPYMTNGHRDYRKEYQYYAGKPSEIHKRVLRNAARRELMAQGLVHKHDGKDVDHIKPLSKGGSADRSNLRAISAHDNRSYKRTASGSIK